MDNDNIDIIDIYLSGNMSSEDRASFEKQLNEDAALLKNVKIQELVQSGMEEIGIRDFAGEIQSVEEGLDQAGFFSDENELNIIRSLDKKGTTSFEETILDVEKNLDSTAFFKHNEIQSKQSETKIISLSRRQVLSIAASILLIVSFTWMLWPKTISSDALYAAYYSIPVETLSQLIEEEKSEFGFSDADEEELNILSDAMNYYNSNSFQQFLEETERIKNSESLIHFSDQIILYRAISLMELGQFDKAELEFSTITKMNDKIRWYQILNLLRLDRTDEAKTLLSRMSKNDNNAIRLKKELQSN